MGDALMRMPWAVKAPKVTQPEPLPKTVSQEEIQAVLEDQRDQYIQAVVDREKKRRKRWWR
jgi:hypothetical protein